jgi:hypothetical protein
MMLTFPRISLLLKQRLDLKSIFMFMKMLLNKHRKGNFVQVNLDYGDMRFLVMTRSERFIHL